MLLLVNNYFVRKTTLVFHSTGNLWDFFNAIETKEFRLDTLTCSVTGRFSTNEIQLAKEKWKAEVKNEE
jgi:hypothetical protein